VALSTIVSLAILTGLGLIPVKYWLLRSWRTYALLGGTAVVVVLFGAVGVRPLAFLQSGLVGGVGLVMLRGNESLWAISDRDRAFVDAYSAVGTEMKALKKVVESTPPPLYHDRFSELITRLEQVNAPSSDWAALKEDAIGQLKRRLSAMRAGVLLSEDEFEAFDREWQDLQARFFVLMRRKTNFWRPWP
jgi:hypothetical protein